MIYLINAHVHVKYDYKNIYYMEWGLSTCFSLFCCFFG